MTSSAEKLEKFEGETVELVCVFNASDFSLFDHPTVWYKTQLLRHNGSDGVEVYNESSQINMMRTVRAPFAATKRFRPSFRPSPPTFRFALTITGS